MKKEPIIGLFAVCNERKRALFPYVDVVAVYDKCAPCTRNCFGELHNEISSLLVADGKPHINYPETTDITRDKWGTYLLCREEKVPTPRTELFSKQTVTQMIQ